MPDAQDQRAISLRPLYDFVRKYESEEQPIRKERTPIGREYGRLCSSLTDAIDLAQGFYLWGHYDRKRYWRSLYLGKTEFRKTSHLRARICEELKDERWFVWRHVHSRERVLKICSAIYPSDSHSRFCERAMLKAGTTHIIWVPAPSLRTEEIAPVEADLIEALNPKVNINRPTPPNTVQQAATEIFQAFRCTIHKSRDSAFNLSLRDA